MGTNNTDVEYYIRNYYSWTKLPANIKQSLGNNEKEYNKVVVQFSIRHQLRYTGNLVRYIRKNQETYYWDLLKYSRENLMLFPYHLSDIIVRGMRVTPFAYYIDIMKDIMVQEKSYDQLPNFTAADCVRLLGIGRNQYIELMNQCRSSKRVFTFRTKRPLTDLLPSCPIEVINIEPWWLVQVGYIIPDDVKQLSSEEKSVIDELIDIMQRDRLPQQASKGKIAGTLDHAVIHSLYRKGLIYLDVPINDDDYIIVPPLEGFVMNRLLDDYFEKLLYNIFVSIDENTCISELAALLQIDLSQVKNAVSLYCRLGFAYKKGINTDHSTLHPSWVAACKVPTSSPSSPVKDPAPPYSLVTNTSKEAAAAGTQQLQQTRSRADFLLDFSEALERDNVQTPSTPMLPPDVSSPTEKVSDSADSAGGMVTPDEDDVAAFIIGAHSKRIALIYDSTLTAFLMMGNLSPGLKRHAVTMFEVGKLSEESMDSFLAELDKVSTEAEGEAQRYFDHAITLKNTILYLRNNKDLISEDNNSGLGLDLIRCESLHGLDQSTYARVLNRNYHILLSMAPLSNEVKSITSSIPHHFGPAIPEVNSIWFKMFLYTTLQSGPPSLLLVKGSRLRRLPTTFHSYQYVLVTTWGHDPTVVATSNVLLILNDALTHGPVLIQGYSHKWKDGCILHIPFPLHSHNSGANKTPQKVDALISKLDKVLNLRNTCGFVTLLNPWSKPAANQQAPPLEEMENAVLMGDYDMDVASSPYSNLSATESMNAGMGDAPTNGITDSVSAEMLRSELDQLVGDDTAAAESSEGAAANTNKQEAASDGGAMLGPGCVDGAAPSITINTESISSDRDFSMSPMGVGHHSLVTTTDITNMNDGEWLLLDCSFGVPLFDSDLNKDVCCRIISQKLFDKASLQSQLDASRRLSLQLLHFISAHQSAAVSCDENSGFPSCVTKSSLLSLGDDKNEEQPPLPSHSVFFDGCALSVWK